MSEDQQPAEAIGQPLVSIVMLNWNSPVETTAAVEAIFKMDYSNYRVLVIDNGSTDNSMDILRHISDARVDLMEAGVNHGYTGGCNIGLKRALERGAEYVWLLNNDAVTAPTTLSSLVALAQSDTTIGLLSPLIASDDAVPRTTFAGGICDLDKNLLDQTEDITTARKWVEDNPAASVVLGTALLIRTSLIRDIGILDESLFMYFEDTDYSMRSLKAGYRNVVDWSSTVYHPEKSMHTDPSSIKPHYWYYMSRNEIRFWRKHLSTVKSVRPLLWTIRRGLSHRNLGHTDFQGGEAILAGLWHGFLNKSGAYHSKYRMPFLLSSLLKSYEKRLAKRA